MRPRRLLSLALLAVVGLAGCDSDGDDGTSARGEESTTSATGSPATTAPPRPKVLVVDYTRTYVREDNPPPEKFRVELSADGVSFRQTSADGTSEYAYDAGSGRAYEWSKGRPGVPESVTVTEGLATAGPDYLGLSDDPGLGYGIAVRTLGRAGDPRVASAERNGRPTWRYDGPYPGNRLGGVIRNGRTIVDDHAVVDVDRATGAVLFFSTSGQGQETFRFEATSVSERDREDRARYRPDGPPSATLTREDHGFRAMTLDEVAAAAGYDVLVPASVPAGFELDEVVFDADEPLGSGAEALNPAPAKVTSMRWHDPATNAAFGVTLLPENGDPAARQQGQVWSDPFGGEGSEAPSEPVNIPLEGRPALQGELYGTPPTLPHLWGISGDLVVVIEGDLDAAGLRAVAGSLRRHTPAAPASAAPASCPPIGFTPNSDDVAGDINATGVDCKEADRLVRKVTERGSAGAPVPRFFHQDAYTCRGVFNDGPGLANTAYRCDDGARRVTWTKT